MQLSLDPSSMPGKSHPLFLTNFIFGRLRLLLSSAQLRMIVDHVKRFETEQISGPAPSAGADFYGHAFRADPG